MRFQEMGSDVTTPDLILVIEIQDVKEASDTGSLSSGSSDTSTSGCCDDVSTIRWMVPVCTAVELIVLIVCCSILLKWWVKHFFHFVRFMETLEILNFITKNTKNE